MSNHWINRYIGKSRNSLHEAQVCLEHGLHRAAIARAYYALYQAANAWMCHRGYPRNDQTRDNWHHNEVNKNWVRILADLGVTDYDADAIYNTAQDFRVRIEYKTGPEPGPRDAAECVDDCQRGVAWILGAFKKEGIQ